MTATRLFPGFRWSDCPGYRDRVWLQLRIRDQPCPGPGAAGDDLAAGLGRGGLHRTQSLVVDPGVGLPPGRPAGRQHTLAPARTQTKTANADRRNYYQQLKYKVCLNFGV